MSGLMFKPALIREIVRGKKTMTRRLVKHDKAGTLRDCRYKIGRTYAVQPGRGKPSDGTRVLITDVRTELLGEISFDDARAEGFRTTDDFKRYWVRLHDEAWLERQAQAADVPAADLDDELLDARFLERHAELLVWVIAFELSVDEVLYLHRHTAGGYTTNPAEAMRGDAGTPREIAPPAAVVDRYASEAAKRDTERRQHVVDQALEVAGSSRPRRLAVLEKLAEESDVDVSNQLRAIERRLEAVEQKIRRSSAA